MHAGNNRDRPSTDIQLIGGGISEIRKAGVQQPNGGDLPHS